MEARRDIYQAIADPTRREIINLIAQRPLNLNSIAENFDVSRQAISLHIRILRECGLIKVKRRGRERVCSVRPEQLDEVAGWLDNVHKLWERRFKQLDTLLGKGKTQ